LACVSGWLECCAHKSIAGFRADAVRRHIDKHFRLFEEFARMTEKTEQPTPQTKNKNWRGIPDSEIVEILRDYNMVPSPNRMEYTKEIIRTLMERNT
jgi:hypothetical protein